MMLQMKIMVTTKAAEGPSSVDQARKRIQNWTQVYKKNKEMNKHW